MKQINEALNKQYDNEKTELFSAHMLPPTAQTVPRVEQESLQTAQIPLPSDQTSTSTAQNPPPTDREPLLTHEQFRRELSYRAAMAILREMQKNGLITAKEFVTIAPNLAERFSPVWGHLYQRIA